MNSAQMHTASRVVLVTVQARIDARGTGIALHVITTETFFVRHSASAPLCDCTVEASPPLQL